MPHGWGAVVAENGAGGGRPPATRARRGGERGNTPRQRPTKYPPAVTMVAAWISAETGVGPCMASGSQIYRGIWADLPVQPRNRKRVIAVAAAPPGRKAAGALGQTLSESSEPMCVKMRNIATRNPQAPIRLTMN